MDMRSENRIAEERRARLRVLPGGLLEKSKSAQGRAQARTSRSERAWKIFVLGLFAGILITFMVAYIRLVLRF